jgi:hypothetical protein
MRRRYQLNKGRRKKGLEDLERAFARAELDIKKPPTAAPDDNRSAQEPVEEENTDHA